MNLSSIYVDHIVSLKEPFDRKPNRLYVTDVGACPRSVAYRLRDTKKPEVSEQTIINQEMMFDVALYIESKLIDALKASMRLLGEQGSIPFDDRDNWGGRYDIWADYYGSRIIEVKTMRSNAFNYSSELPKDNHAYQATIYDHYLHNYLGLTANPLLWYADRGGANTPVECTLEAATIWPKACALMDELDQMRDNLPDMPGQLPAVLKLRNRNKEVKQEPDYRCSYCDYKDVCDPDVSTSVFAKLGDNGVWRVTRRGTPHIDKLIEFGIEVTQ